MKNLQYRQVIDIILIVALLIFIVQNLEVVMVNFLSFGFQLPLVVLILAVFALGFYTANVFRKK